MLIMVTVRAKDKPHDVVARYLMQSGKTTEEARRAFAAGQGKEYVGCIVSVNEIGWLQPDVFFNIEGLPG